MTAQQDKDLENQDANTNGNQDSKDTKYDKDKVSEDLIDKMIAQAEQQAKIKQGKKTNSKQQLQNNENNPKDKTTEKGLKEVDNDLKAQQAEHGKQSETDGKSKSQSVDEEQKTKQNTGKVDNSKDKNTNNQQVDEVDNEPDKKEIKKEIKQEVKKEMQQEIKNMAQDDEAKPDDQDHGKYPKPKGPDQHSPVIEEESQNMSEMMIQAEHDALQKKQKQSEVVEHPADKQEEETESDSKDKYTEQEIGKQSQNIEDDTKDKASEQQSGSQEKTTEKQDIETQAQSQEPGNQAKAETGKQSETDGKSQDIDNTELNQNRKKDGIIRSGDNTGKESETKDKTNEEQTGKSTEQGGTKVDNDGKTKQVETDGKSKFQDEQPITKSVSQVQKESGNQQSGQELENDLKAQQDEPTKQSESQDKTDKSAKQEGKDKADKQSKQVVKSQDQGKQAEEGEDMEQTQMQTMEKAVKKFTRQYILNYMKARKQGGYNKLKITDEDENKLKAQKKELDEERQRLQQEQQKLSEQQKQAQHQELQIDQQRLRQQQQRLSEEKKQLQEQKAKIAKQKSTQELDTVEKRAAEMNQKLYDIAKQRLQLKEQRLQEQQKMLAEEQSQVSESPVQKPTEQGGQEVENDFKAQQAESGKKSETQEKPEQKVPSAQDRLARIQAERQKYMEKTKQTQAEQSKQVQEDQQLAEQSEQKQDKVREEVETVFAEKEEKPSEKDKSKTQKTLEQRQSRMTEQTAKSSKKSTDEQYVPPAPPSANIIGRMTKWFVIIGFFVLIYFLFFYDSGEEEQIAQGDTFETLGITKWFKHLQPQKSESIKVSGALIDKNSPAYSSVLIDDDQRLLNTFDHGVVLLMFDQDVNISCDGLLKVSGTKATFTGNKANNNDYKIQAMKVKQYSCEKILYPKDWYQLTVQYGYLSGYVINPFDQVQNFNIGVQGVFNEQVTLQPQEKYDIGLKMNCQNIDFGQDFHKTYNYDFYVYLQGAYSIFNKSIDFPVSVNKCMNIDVIPRFENVGDYVAGQIKVLKDQDFYLTVHIQNNGGVDLQNAQILLEFPSVIYDEDGQAQYYMQQDGQTLTALQKRVGDIPAGDTKDIKISLKPINITDQVHIIGSLRSDNGVNEKFLDRDLIIYDDGVDFKVNKTKSEMKVGDWSAVVDIAIQNSGIDSEYTFQLSNQVGPGNYEWYFVNLFKITYYLRNGYSNGHTYDLTDKSDQRRIIEKAFIKKLSKNDVIHFKINVQDVKDDIYMSIIPHKDKSKATKIKVYSK